MKRLEFIKGLFAASGMAVLPSVDFKQYQKIYLHQSFVRGFQYYMGQELIDNMKQGEILELVREPENKYDESAIALYYQGHKIGYIPAESNETLSKIIDANLLELHCQITAINTKAMAWENIFIALYALKPLDKSEITPIIENLTIQETPEYHTVYDEEKVYRFSKS
jgi:hypothetical protein